jgi:transposase InsO family protein
VNVLPFIEAEKVAGHDTVKRSCELLEVSRSAFYEWHEHVPSARERADVELGERIQHVFDESRGTYGWPRVHRALRDAGVHASRKRVARIMRTKGLVGRCRRRWVKTTVSDANVVAVDLLQRTFGPGTVELDRVYVGDITYIRTWEGWLYLATVIDLASRRVVGWAMAEHMRAELVCDALRMAIENRQPAPGAIFHSDRGTSIHLEGVHRPARRPPDHPIDLAPPAMLGQRSRGELLRVAQTRMHLPPNMANTCTCTPSCVRLHRGVLQPTPTALRARLLHARHLREHDPQPHHRSRGITTMSGEPGQPQMVFVRAEPCFDGRDRGGWGLSERTLSR